MSLKYQEKQILLNKYKNLELSPEEKKYRLGLIKKASRKPRIKRAIISISNKVKDEMKKLRKRR